MSIWAFLTIIIVVSVLAGTFTEYHKRNRTSRNETDNELEALKKEIGKVKKRLENLEAIAAADPGEFADLHKKAANEKDPAEDLNEIIEKRRNKSW